VLVEVDDRAGVDREDLLELELAHADHRRHFDADVEQQAELAARGARRRALELGELDLRDGKARDRLDRRVRLGRVGRFDGRLEVADRGGARGRSLGGGGSGIGHGHALPAGFLSVAARRAAAVLGVGGALRRAPAAAAAFAFAGAFAFAAGFAAFAPFAAGAAAGFAAAAGVCSSPTTSVTSMA
jgi:hypothetical protein